MKPWSEEIQEKPEKCLKRRKLGAGGSERRPAGRVTLLLVSGRWVVGGGWEIFTFNFTAYRGKEETQGKYNPHPQSSKLGQWVSRQDGQQAVSRWIWRALRQTAYCGQAVSGGVYLRSTRPAPWLGLVRHWQISNGTKSTLMSTNCVRGNSNWLIPIFLILVYTCRKESFLGGKVKQASVWKVKNLSKTECKADKTNLNLQAHALLLFLWIPSNMWSLVRQFQAVDVGLRRRQWLLICSRNLTVSRQKKNIVLLYPTKEIQDILQNIHTIYLVFTSSRPS